MDDKVTTKKLDQKVIFMRVDEDLYSRLSALAKEEDRTVNSLSIHLLRKALKKELDANK